MSDIRQTNLHSCLGYCHKLGSRRSTVHYLWTLNAAIEIETREWHLNMRPASQCKHWILPIKEEILRAIQHLAVEPQTMYCFEVWGMRSSYSRKTTFAVCSTTFLHVQEMLNLIRLIMKECWKSQIHPQLQMLVFEPIGHQETKIFNSILFWLIKYIIRMNDL
jgi:hypothetical protein